MPAAGVPVRSLVRRASHSTAAKFCTYISTRVLYYAFLIVLYFYVLFRSTFIIIIHVDNGFALYDNNTLRFTYNHVRDVNRYLLVVGSVNTFYDL